MRRPDNSNLPAKLELRRYFLRKYHASGGSVLDCCQGEGVIWSRLRKEFDLGYWGVDLKPKRGRLRIDSVQVLRQPGWRQDIIDIDVYGSPWKHWLAMLPNVARPTTVFLTHSTAGRLGGGRALQKIEFEVMGVPNQWEWANLPKFSLRLWELSVPYLLSKASEHGVKLHEAQEAVVHGNMRYVGVRLSKGTNDE